MARYPVAPPLQSRIVTGEVMHRRHQPVQNGFVYPVFYLLLNIDELEQLNSPLLGINRLRPLSFSFKDYGDGSHPREWISALLKQHRMEGCEHEIWVQTFPRVAGYQFNPVSFWYCKRSSGEVGAIIAEVNNTFGERHCYLLTPNSDGNFTQLHRNKAFYVSPFYPVEGEYQFSFNLDMDAPRVVIDYYQQGLLQLNTAIWGQARPINHSNLARALLKQPLLTLGIMFKIHWQALRLWQKRVPLIQKPSEKIEEFKS